MGFTAGNMGSASLMMQGAGAATSAVGAYYGAQSQQSALGYQADIAALNAHMAEMSAQQELFKGNTAVANLTQRAGQIKGAQRAAMAANGIDLGSSSATEVLTSTDMAKENDVNTITANAVRAAWGYRTQATNYQNEAMMKRSSADSINPLTAGATSLMGSAGSVAQNWYQMSKNGDTTGASKRAYLPDSLRGGQ